MKKIILLLAAAFMAVAASAQSEKPTVNWPYIFPDFEQGIIEKVGGVVEKAGYNIHLNIGALHYLENGKIKEHPTAGVKSMTIGETVFRNVGGKMLKVLAQTEGGFVVMETLANFTGIISRDGAYGGAVAGVVDCGDHALVKVALMDHGGIHGASQAIHTGTAIQQAHGGQRA